MGFGITLGQRNAESYFRYEFGHRLGLVTQCVTQRQGLSYWKLIGGLGDQFVCEIPGLPADIGG
jgi:hypothetical protein